jgi:hypothetical protein
MFVAEGVAGAVGVLKGVLVTVGGTGVGLAGTLVAEGVGEVTGGLMRILVAVGNTIIGVPLGRIRT